MLVGWRCRATRATVTSSTGTAVIPVGSSGARSARCSPPSRSGWWSGPSKGCSRRTPWAGRWPANSRSMRRPSIPTPLNVRSREQYFPNKVHQQLVREPLLTVNKPEAYDVMGNLAGGGTSGQAGALRLAIARALVELNIDDRPALKKAGFLTRDPRMKERKKYGLKKARKAPQYSKR